MLRKLLLLILLFTISRIDAQIPAHYYDNANGKNGTALQLALHNIIKGHTAVSYSQIWTTVQTTDKRPDDGKVWDIYSDIPGGTPPYEFTFVTNQCGSYQHEGDCYNREHSFPQSWFNKAAPMKTDLFHIYPTDGKVNGMRSSHPYGEVSAPTWTSMNGSKLGPNTTAGYSGTAFEPIDAYKGDVARSYFYMAVRYYLQDNGWKDNAAVHGSQMKPWELNLLHQWSIQDPVSQKEINRNNAIYGIQHNRNPFIDHPEWVDSIWFNTTSIKKMNRFFVVDIYPNPANNNVNIKLGSFNTHTFVIALYDLSGRKLQEVQSSNLIYTLNLSTISKGIYIIKVNSTDGKLSKTLKLIKK